LVTAADFTALNALNLRNANGTNRDFLSTLANNKKDLSSWLTGATATNMANMLSAQLAATVLNVRHLLINASGYIYVGTPTTANPLLSWSGNSQGSNLTGNLGTLVNAAGFVKVQDLINAADSS